MTMLPSFATLAPPSFPFTDALARGLFEEPTREATALYQEDYARRVGYVRGPDGEWFTYVR
jgi:hypothetical protein